MKLSSVTIQMKATEQYFPVVLFIMLYKVVLTFDSVDGFLKCGHSNRKMYSYFVSYLVCCIVHLLFLVASIYHIDNIINGY